MRPAGNARTPPCRQYQRPIRQTRLVCQHPPACRRHTLWQSPRIFSRRPGVLGVKRHNSRSIQHSCILSASCVALRSSLGRHTALRGLQAIDSRRLQQRRWLGHKLHRIGFHPMQFPPHGRSAAGQPVGLLLGRKQPPASPPAPRCTLVAVFTWPRPKTLLCHLQLR